MALPMLFALAGNIKAQTASEKPLSAVISRPMKDQLVKKKPDAREGSSITKQRRLPSESAVPRQAKEAKDKRTVWTLPSGERNKKLPSNSELDVEEITKRNEKYRLPEK